MKETNYYDLEQADMRDKSILDSLEVANTSGVPCNYSEEQILEAQKREAQKKKNEYYDEVIIPITNDIVYVLYYISSLITLPVLFYAQCNNKDLNWIVAVTGYLLLIALAVMSKIIDKFLKSHMSKKRIWVDNLKKFSAHTSVFAYLLTSLGYMLTMMDGFLFWFIYGVMCLLFIIATLHYIIKPIMNKKYCTKRMNTMIKILQINTRLFISFLKSSCGFVFGVASAGLLFLDKKQLKIDTIKEEVLALIVLLIFAAICAVIRTVSYRKIECIKDKLILRYGDLWKHAFTRNKKIVVVNVNTSFDTIVDENLSKVNNPLVSPITIHGQWIKQMQKKKVSISDIDKGIENSLRLQKIEPIKVLERSVKDRGKLNCYPKGTIACYEYENTIFYLLALSEFDENNNAQNTKEELVQTIIKLIDYYDKHGNGLDIYVPIMGTGQSRTGIHKAEALEVIRSLFRLYEDKIHGCANIIVYSKDRDEVSIGG